MNHIGTKEKNNFTSYLPEFQDGGAEASLPTRLLAGEQEVASASLVVLHPPVTNKDDANTGLKGRLVVTNFKLSFITLEDSQSANFVYQENIFLGKNDVTLSNIDLIYQVVDKKKKIVSPETKISSRIDYLIVICKNFRMLKFGFKHSEAKGAKQIADALQTFAFPNVHNLIFSYTYKEKYYNTIRNVTMFNKKSDWVSELHRCGASTKDWRVLYIENQRKLPDGSMPMSYVIPKDITDEDYLQNAQTFRGNRNAVWVYQYERASLIRMAELPEKTDNKVENLVIERVRACHPTKRQPHIMDLTRPTLQAINSSYKKLRQLCTPDNPKTFSEQDDKFLKHLEASSWLLHVSQCLSYAHDVAERMKNGETVILQENEGRDMCCVISSLSQIILDAYVRTINGFQSLVQKEWVALGHPFSDRLGHVNNVNNAMITEECPLFLLFLDCTWQLLQQYPQDFEFTETYLTTLWDSAFMPLFDTFQFNSERDRLVASKAEPERLILRPVWDWGEQFADKDIVYFSNPCYRRPAGEPTRRSVVIPASAIPLPIIGAPDYHVQGAAARQVMEDPTGLILNPQSSVKWLDVWVQCYYRWLPIVEIPNGGMPQVELFHRVILSNVCKLQQALQTGDFDELPAPQQNGTERAVQNLPSVNSFFPFSRNNSDPTELTDILMASNEILVDGSIFDAISQAHIE
uniref:Putative phosphatidylinositol 3-phosphate 3-phosphatase myotubularin mtm1 n=1 Tax=Phlebotomus kandelakii TaxID=1109342 RepID=A0A6B2ECL4_9DIPT